MSEETCGDCGRLLVGTLDELWRSPSYNCVRYDADLLDDGDEDTMIGRANCREFTIALLRSQLSAATARASELERELAGAKAMLSGVHNVVARRDTELAAMGERVARTERENEAWRALIAWAKKNKNSATIYGVALVAGEAHSMEHDPVAVATELGLIAGGKT